MQRDFFFKISIFFSFLGIAFILAPIIHLFISVSAESLFHTIKDKEVWRAIFTSFWGALWATFIGLFIGVPLGYFLSKTNFKGKGLIESIINLPVAIPHVAAGIALLSLFNPRGILGKFFAFFHISFMDTIYGVILAMLFVSFSFIIGASISGFSGVDEELEMVSRSLGASPFYTFFHITLPLAFPAILRGSVLAFARGASEVGALLVLAYYPKTAPILMLDRFEQFGLKEATPVTVLVIFCSLFSFAFLFFISKKYAQS